MLNNIENNVGCDLVQFQLANTTNTNFLFNTTPNYQQISVNNQVSVNATTKYEYDFTGATLSCGYATIIVNAIVYNVIFTSNNLVSLIASLNALNFGFFSYLISGVNTYVYTYDNINIYGNIDICGSTPPPTLISFFAKKTGGRTITVKYGINDSSTPYTLGDASVLGALYTISKPLVSDIVYVSCFRDGDTNDKPICSLNMGSYTTTYICLPSVTYDGSSDLYFNCNSATLTVC